MRIIAGEARGRRLKAPDTKGTRPVTDRVREAVFSSVGSWVVDAKVADLYAGSGSFGLEALSRGAESAVFVENGRKALVALRENITQLGLGGAVEATTVAAYLERTDDRFHLVFIDPPWPMENAELEDNFLRLDSLLEPKAEVVTSRRAGGPMPISPETWRVAADKRYGDTRIIRYEKVENDDDGSANGTLSRQL